MKHEGAKGRNLHTKIESLRDEFGDEMVDDLLHEVREAGNSSAHDGVAHTHDEVADISELVNAVVIVVYDQPAQRAAMRESRRERRAAEKGSLETAKKAPMTQATPNSHGPAGRMGSDARYLSL